MDELSVFIGFHGPAAEAFDICRYSIDKYASRPVPVHALRQPELRQRGLYTRCVDTKASNEFSMTRWLTPYLAETRYALFMDSDMLFTADLWDLIEGLDPSKAVHVVKHNYSPRSPTKMAAGGGVQRQYAYPRKNWSSFVIWNCQHPAVAQVTPDLVNTAEPAHLHRFSFLRDDEIGDIGHWTTASGPGGTVRVPLVNFLVGEYPQPAELPLVLHYTLAIPGIHEDVVPDYRTHWLDLRDESRAGKSPTDEESPASTKPAALAAG